MVAAPVLSAQGTVFRFRRRESLSQADVLFCTWRSGFTELLVEVPAPD